MKYWRLIDSGILPGALNMGIDEALLQLHAHGEAPPTLRFYQWNPPAVSFGCLQRRTGFDTIACNRLGLDVVKRPTGGRAVLHRDDLTYSVIAGSRDGMPLTLSAAYRLLCKGLLSGFRRLGIEAELGQEKVHPGQPDLCFLSSNIGDIVYKGKKFVGSAQTWLGSTLLQHGSIVLKPQGEMWAKLLTSDGEIRQRQNEELKNRTTSLCEILDHIPPVHMVKSAIIEGMENALDMVLVEGSLTPAEWALANDLAKKQETLCALLQPQQAP